MRIAYKKEGGVVITDVNEAPNFEYLLITSELEEKFIKFLKPNINKDFNDFIETATDEEIKLNEKPKVPDTVSRMGLKIQLLIKGIKLSEIIDTINSIPNHMFSQQRKEIAIIKFEEAAYFDRYNGDLQLIAILIGLTQDDLDDIFINGNKN